MSTKPGGRLESQELTIEGDRPLTLDEIKNLNAGGGGVEVEPITGVQANKDEIALEAFMNEFMVIRIHEDLAEGALPIVTVNVNGINQPIVRGQSTRVRRKFVEALASSKETKYQQVQTNPFDPSSLEMRPKTALTYGFSVERDDNPHGAAWLKGLIQRAAG